MKPRRANRCPSRSDDRGIALLAVLVLIALLTLLATSVAALSVSQRRAAQRFEQAVQADNTADSAIRLVLLRLFARTPGVAAGPVEWRQQIDVLGKPVEVMLERESGRVDLNFADEALLRATFATHGWSEKAAHRMAARIDDWRDADDTALPNGAERADYAAAGLSYGPRNGAFESPEELRRVAGGDEIAAELLEAFTVYSHMRTPPVAEGPAPSSLAGEMVRVRACVALQAHDRCRIVVVRLTGSTVSPFQVFSWRNQFR